MVLLNPTPSDIWFEVWPRKDGGLGIIFDTDEDCNKIYGRERRPIISVYLMPMGLNSSKKFSRGSKVLRKKTSSKAKEMFLIRNGS